MREEQSRAARLMGGRSGVLVLIVLAVLLAVAAVLTHGTLAWIEAGLAAGLLLLLAVSYAVRRHSRAALLYRPLRRRYVRGSAADQAARPGVASRR